jgi:hypothetical protein
MRNPVRLPGALANRKRVVTIAGAAVALVGIGTASAATVEATSHAPISHAVQVASRNDSASRPGVTTAAASTQRSQAKTAASAVPQQQTWQQISQTVAQQTSPSEPALANQLTPVGTTGAQNTMQISGAQLANATTIVQQALAKHMGVRSAVIAVATAMQESQLQNISYGTSDSLGLFQQQPVDGWGTAQQIMNPAYSADAFLGALQQYQASNPSWATQPLWASAQAVQKSGYPTAYAQWESQAAQLVQQIVTQVR